MRKRLALLALLPLVGVCVAFVSWLTWVRRPGADRGEVLAGLEQALVGPGAEFALIHVDLAKLRAWLPEQGAALEAALLDAAGLGPVETGGEVARVLFAVSGEGETARRAAVLIGRFDPDALEAALTRDAAAGGEISARGAERVIRLDRVDTETCRGTRVELALRPERIAISLGAPLDPLLEQLGDLGVALPAADAAEPLASARWSGALAPLAPLVGPGGRALLALVSEPLAGASGGRARLSADRRGRPVLALELDTRDAGAAAELGAALGTLRAERREAWSANAPALARWLDAFELSSEGAVLRAEARPGPEGRKELPALADESRVLAAAALLAIEPEPGPASEPWPPTFREALALASLPAYRADEPLAGPADALAGPFGLRIERVRAGDGLELTLRAVGPDVPNLPAPEAAPRLVIEKVESADAATLLHEPRCGPERAAHGEPLLRRSPAELIEAAKTVRLRPGTALDAVASIRGRIELELPLRTERVVARELRAGERLEIEGAALELTALAGHGFAYRARGAVDRLLHVRGLDESGAPLPGRRAWQTLLPVSGEQVGAVTHAGRLAAVEAVFALERERVVFPFALGSPRPGTDGEALLVASSSFIRYSAAQYDREFGALRAQVAASPRFRALAAAGPFRVGLAELGAAGQLEPRLAVLAPDIPNLSYYTAGLELSLARLRLADGRELALDARTRVAPAHKFGAPELEGEVRLATGVAGDAAQVASLAGELLLRLPTRVEAAEFAAVEPGRSVAAGGLSIALDELARDAFVLRVEGERERFFSARAFAADGHELAVRLTAVEPVGNGAHALRFHVQGQPQRIAVQLARELALRRYPFELALPSLVPAVPAATSE